MEVTIVTCYYIKYYCAENTASTVYAHLQQAVRQLSTPLTYNLSSIYHLTA